MAVKSLRNWLANVISPPKWITTDRDDHWLQQTCTQTGQTRYVTRMVRFMMPFSKTKFAAQHKQENNHGRYNR